MAALGKPAITTPRSLDLKAVQDAIATARQRIEALERAVASVAGQAGQTAYSGGGGASASTVAIQTLQAQITALDLEVNTLQDQMAALLALADGFVTITGGVLGSASGALGGDTVLYDNEGRALLTGDGRALLTGT